MFIINSPSIFCYVVYYICVPSSCFAYPSGALSNAERVLRPEVPFDLEEVTNLRKTCTELREVVRYMKRERDILEARQSVAEGETSRLESSLAVVQRALDEVRGELKRELDAKVAARGEGDFERLTAEVTQVSESKRYNTLLFKLHLGEGELAGLSKWTRD